VRRVEVRQRGDQSDEDHYSVTRGGKPVEGINPERITLEEEVMEWRDATHIHHWFVMNVQGGKTDGKQYLVSQWDLRKLLEVCEKVLDGSHLVRAKAFTQSDMNEIHRRMESPGAPAMVIKNVAAAHKLLPMRSEYWNWRTSSDIYGEAYLKDVAATRDWAERMLIDRQKGVLGDIYYSGS